MTPSSLHLDQLEAGLPLVVQGGERPLQGPPGDALAAARLAHQHGRVARVLGLVQLDDLGEGEGRHLQAAAPQLGLDRLLQLQRYVAVVRGSV